MKLKKIIPIVAVAVLSSCSLTSLFKKNKDKPKDPKPALQIPTIDVENLSVNLPNKPVYNTGSIKSVTESDVTYDYLDFYEVSDFHGAVNYEASSSGTAKIGLARLATYLDNKRAENEGGTFVLSSGDMFQGSAESNLTKGYMVNYAMQYMGFDAMAIGNHEFDWTDEWIKKNAELQYNTSTIPYLGINIIDKRTNEMPSYLKKSVTIERGGYKVGIIGSIGETLTTSILASCVENYRFEAESDLVRNEAARLRGEGCDFVIWLAHEGLDTIKVVEGVDAIFGGHAHINGSSNISVPMAATKNYGQGIAHISFKVNRNTKKYTVNACSVDEMNVSSVSSLAENQGVKSIMDQYNVEVNKIKNIKLAHSNEDLTIDGALKGICCKSMYDSAIASVTTGGIKNLSNETIDTSKVICALHNVSGGIRSDIAKGDITYGSVFTSFPFDNEIIMLRLKGSYIQQKMDLSSLGAYKKFGSLSDLNANDYYYIITTDYLATGELKREESTLIHTGKIVRDVVAEYVYNLDEINGNDFMRKAEFNNIAF